MRWNGEKLSDAAPAILIAPAYNKARSKQVTWEHDFKITLGNRSTVTGYACLFDSWAKQHTALNYFWRDRLIRGNIEPFNRPIELFGAGNSFRTGRLYIELDASQFRVTSDKKAIDFERSDTSEGELLEKLKFALSKESIPILQQGENYRSRRTDDDLVPAIEKALASAKVAAEHGAPKYLSSSAAAAPAASKPSTSALKIGDQLIRHDKLAFRITCSDAGTHEPWIHVDWDETHKKPIHTITINLQHAFVHKHLTRASVPIFVGIAVSIVYGEFKARTLLADKSSLVRNFTDQFLRIIANSEESIDDAY